MHTNEELKKSISNYRATIKFCNSRISKIQNIDCLNTEEKARSIETWRFIAKCNMEEIKKCKFLIEQNNKGLVLRWVKKSELQTV